MYSADMAARRMGLVDWDVAMGVPLAIGAKIIFLTASSWKAARAQPGRGLSSGGGEPREFGS
ncbi:MAG: hypothetical protein KJ921_01995 [Proteobacteria bacterium]|nr:hypothetical protein [Pseudomonadota bacterium]